VGAVLALTTLTASCSSGSSSSTPAATTTAAVTTTTSAADAHTVTVTAGDINGVAGPMTYDASTDTVKAGEVTFVLDNVGTELVVLKTDTPYDQLVIGSDDRVDEADSVGEVSETPAGETASVTLNLTPGKYVLVCNIGGHYRLGMRVPLTVTA